MSVLPVSSSSTVPSPSAGRLQAVRERLDAACAAAQRPIESIALLAVSKTFSAQAVADMVSAGQTAFGENYIQEGVDKIADLAALLRSGKLVLVPGNHMSAVIKPELGQAFVAALTGDRW